jgi:hypothetical protein
MYQKNVVPLQHSLLKNKNMVGLQENNVEILPDGYSEWRKDIEELIEIIGI